MATPQAPTLTRAEWLGAFICMALCAAVVWYVAARLDLGVWNAALICGAIVGAASIPMGGIGLAVLFVVALAFLLGPIGILAAVAALILVYLIRRRS